jgi:hypothetical protein
MKNLSGIIKEILNACLMFLVLVSTNSSAHNEGEVCLKIKNLFAAGNFLKYEVPFKQPEPDYLEYEFVFGNANKKDVIKAYCGNGSDAICEMTLFENERESFNFSLPATIRVLEVDKKIYVVNGVIIHKNNQITFNNYTVHQLFHHEIKIICSK